MHGQLCADDGLDKPRVVAKSNEAARPGYNTRSATEFVDTPAAMRAKVKILARLVNASRTCVVYTGAGISTAAGMADYASKAKGSIAPHKERPSNLNRLALMPTYGHHCIAALERKGKVQHWLQQNHDRLSQKAGFPQAKLNEIHGAWGDDKNQVKMMDDTLRKDLVSWADDWSTRSDLCIALGTSLCGMTSDCVAESVSSRGGLVIINLQETALDDRAALRIWGCIDDVLALLAKELKMTVPNKAAAACGREWDSRHTRCKYNTPLRKFSDPL